MTLEEFEKARFYKGQVVSVDGVNAFVTRVDFISGLIFFEPVEQGAECLDFFVNVELQEPK